LPLNAGLTHLNGEQAFAYVSNRTDALHSNDKNLRGSDYDRTKRQRELIEKLKNKLRQANIFKLQEMATKVLPNMTTNFSKSEVQEKAKKFLDFVKWEFKEFRLPTDDNVQHNQHEGKMSVEKISDLEKAKSDLKKFLELSE
jgi:anionic cell wall polymer biosynthesis LytR-Cps2A-Psr (LCP) family protein